MTVTKLLRRCHVQWAIFSRGTHGDASKNIIASKVPKVEIPKVSLPSFIWKEGCANHGDKIAIVRFEGRVDSFCKQCAKIFANINLMTSLLCAKFKEIELPHLRSL